ncbi:hypothetical protein J6590_045726, partial [Homalodisca vitripennis]
MNKWRAQTKARTEGSVMVYVETRSTQVQATAADCDKLDSTKWWLIKEVTVDAGDAGDAGVG